MGRGRQSIPIAAPPNAPSRRRYRRYDEEAIEAELRRITADRQHFPSATELERGGRGQLRYALRRRGHAYWADRLGLPLRPGQDRSPYSEADALAEVAMIWKQLGTVPSAEKLRRSGHRRLSSYLHAYGGTRRFCRDHGIALPAVRGWRATGNERD